MIISNFNFCITLNDYHSCQFFESKIKWANAQFFNVNAYNTLILILDDVSETEFIVKMELIICKNRNSNIISGTI